MSISAGGRRTSVVGPASATSKPVPNFSARCRSNVAFARNNVAKRPLSPAHRSFGFAAHLVFDTREPPPASLEVTIPVAVILSTSSGRTGKMPPPGGPLNA